MCKSFDLHTLADVLVADTHLVQFGEHNIDTRPFIIHSSGETESLPVTHTIIHQDHRVEEIVGAANLQPILDWMQDGESVVIPDFFGHQMQYEKHGGHFDELAA